MSVNLVPPTPRTGDPVLKQKPRKGHPWVGTFLNHGKEHKPVHIPHEESDGFEDLGNGCYRRSPL